jgi:serine phosphatase RsbU (regulator of sigma subunit)
MFPAQNFLSLLDHMFLRRCHIFLCVIFLLGLRAFSQEVDLDSLQKEIDVKASDNTSIKELIQLGEKYRAWNLDAAMQCANAALERARESTNKEVLVNAELMLGIVYQDKSDFVNAALWITQAERLAEEINYPWGLLRCFNSLGNCYALQKQSQVAIGYYQKALNLCTALKQDKKRATILGNIGNILYERSEKDRTYLDSALVFYQRAYEMDLALHDTDRMVSMLNNMGLVYGDKQNYNKVRALMAEERPMIEKSRNFDAKVNYYNCLSRLYSYEKNYKVSELYLDSCFALATEVGSVNMYSEVYISRAENAYEQGDFKRAYDFLSIYKHLTDSILNAENFATAADIQHRYEREKKQREIEKLTHRNQNQRIIITSVIVFFLVMVAFAIVLYRRLIENRKQKTIIEQQRNEMLDSIHYAKRIQTALLASEEMLRHHLSEHFILYKPKDIVSGDFYWATSLGDEFIFCLGDCTGHGVPGAFMSLLNTSKLNETINEKKITRPDLVLNEIRKEIIGALNPGGAGHETKDGMDCTLCNFDFKNYTLQYAAANNGIILVRGDEVLTLKPDHMPVGKSPRDNDPFSLNIVQLHKGDIVYMLTDGYADQFGGESGKKYKIKNVKGILLANRHLPMDEQKKVLEENFEKWRGNLEQVDDVAIVGIRIL